MPYLKIDDPEKRDLLVKRFLETKKNIRDRNLVEKTGEIELQSDLSKFFKPITEAQRVASEKITEELKPIKEAAIKLPNYPSIQLFTSKEGEVTMDEDEPEVIGPVVLKYLMKYAGKSSLIDKSYGLYSEGGKFFIGNKEVTINNNDIVLDNETYEGTPGFWELITSRNPDTNIFNLEDYEKYSKLVVKTNTLYCNNNPNEIYPKSSRGKKWVLLSPIWDALKKERVTGTGTIIPCDPNALVKRLKLLLASKAAGNMGVRNEIVSVCDELKRQGYLNVESYKKLMSIL